MTPIWLRYLPGFARKHLADRQIVQKILGNTGWLMTDRILRLGINLVVGVWLARYLGPDQFGLYNYAIALISLLTTLAALGLDTLVVRELVNQPDDSNSILGTVFFLKLISSSMALGLGLTIVPLLSNSDETLHSLVAVLGLGMVLQSADALDFWFQAQMQPRFSVMARTIALLLTSLIKALLILGSAPILAFAWVRCAELGLGAVGLILFYLRQGDSPRYWQLSRQWIRRLLREGLPLMLSGVAIIFYMRVDQIMLGIMAGDQALGIYSAAVRVSELWYFVPVAIAAAVTPAIVESRRDNLAQYYDRLQQVLTALVALAYGIAILISLSAGAIVHYGFGEPYADASPVLMVHIWALIPVCLSLGRDIWILAEGQAISSLLMSVIGALANILFNLYLIPAYGAMGAAIATVISYTIPNYLGCLIYPPLRRLGQLLTRALTLRGWRCAGLG